MRGSAGCTAAQRWWALARSGVDGLAGHRSHHCRQHPLQCLQCAVADPGWQRQTGAGAIDGLAPPARDDACLGWSEALLDPLRPRDTNQADGSGATLCTPASRLPPLPWQSTVMPTLPAILPLPRLTPPSPCPSSDRVVLNAWEVLIDQRLEEGLLGECGSSWWQTGERRNHRNLHRPRIEEELGIAVTVGEELITVDPPTATKSCVLWCTSAIGSRGSQPRQSAGVGAAGGPGNYASRRPTPRLSLRLQVALHCPLLGNVLMQSDGAWSVVVCLGEALIDRLGPPR